MADLHRAGAAALDTAASPKPRAPKRQLNRDRQQSRHKRPREEDVDASSAGSDAEQSSQQGQQGVTAGGRTAAPGGDPLEAWFRAHYALLTASGLMGAGLSPASAETGRLRANGAQRRRGRQQRGAQQQRAGGSARRSRDQRQQERHVASLSTEVRVCRCLPQPPLALAAELSSRPQLYTVQLPLAGTTRCLSVWMLRASFGRHWAATQHGCRKCHSSSPACAGYPHACFQQPGLDLPFHAGRQQRGRGAGCGWQRRAGRLKRRARAGAPADVGLGAPGARRHLRRRFRCVHALAVWQGALLASRRAGRSCIRMRSSSAMLDRERRCRGVHPDEALVFG